MLCGICTECGDTYPLPEGMDTSKQYKCEKCGKMYYPKVVRMDEFVFYRLKTTKEP
jgi:DNA-directed RNA polymerase subunit RPC12/RpoP